MSKQSAGLDPSQWERLRQALAADYEVQEEIGSGGMALVFRARDCKHDRVVALKVLRPELSEALGAARFLREIKTAANLQHPSIVPLYDSGEADGFLYYVMPYVEGATLQERIKEQGPLSMEEAIQIAAEVADALDHAHQKGMVHRDIKPANILFQGGRAMLADFGLATACCSLDETQLTQSGIVVGTPLYMSPEQGSGHRVDERSDLYAFGCVVYEMLAGDPPFTGSSAQAVLARHQSDAVPPVRSVRPQLPAGVDRTLTRALAKVPADRFGSAGEMVEALRAPPRESRLRRGRVIAVAVLVLVLGAMWILQPWKQGDTDTTAYRLVPRTTARLYEADVHWSPSAEFLVFSRMAAGNLDLYLQPVEGGEAVPRVQWPGDEVAPRWSPGGGQIAFVSGQDPGSPICLMRAHQGEPRPLTDTGISPLEADSLCNALGDHPWSRDEEHLLASRVDEQGRLAIFRVPLDGSAPVALTAPPAGSDDLGASYSHDFQHIAFFRRRLGRGALYVMPAQGGEARLVLEDGFHNLMPSWTRGDLGLLYLSTRDTGVANLWQLDLDRPGHPRQLTNERDWLVGYSLSQEGRVALTPYYHNTTLTLLDPDTGAQEPRTNHVGDNFGPRFSPDGRWLAYHSTRDGNSEIYLHDLEDPERKGEVLVAGHPATDVYPDWSPDGKLVFVSDRDGLSKIYLADPERPTSARRLLDAPVYPGDPGAGQASMAARWSPDGSLIGFLRSTEDRTSLWCVRRDGTGEQELVPGARGFDWYRDNDHLIYTKSGQGRDELWLRDLVSGAEEHLFSGAHAELDAAPDGHAILMSHGPAHMGMGLWRLNLSVPEEAGVLPTVLGGGPECLVAPDGNWHVHHGSFDFTSKRMVFIHDQDYSNVYERVPRD